jgi:hypothetical protein
MNLDFEIFRIFFRQIQAGVRWGPTPTSFEWEHFPWKFGGKLPPQPLKPKIIGIFMF